MFWLIPRAIEAGAENLKMIGDQIIQLVADYEESEGSVPFLADYIKDYRDEYWVLAEIPWIICRRMLKSIVLAVKAIRFMAVFGVPPMA